MSTVIKHLLPGILTIVAVSAIILFTDGASRRTAGGLPRVACFQYASRPVLDVAIAGCVEGLKHRGFIDGETMHVTRYNAEGDMMTCNTTAKAIVDERFDMAITASTLCLQSFAKANSSGTVIHVFGTVTDPYGAGVGISAKDHTVHPAWLVGVGSFQPVRDTFLLARRCNPSLKRIGTVMCPTEACSTACLELGRTVAKELGIDIEVAQVYSPNDVREATASLLARGVEAIFIGGDNMVESVIDAVIVAAFKSGVPVIGYASEHAQKGALLGVGVDYFQMGIAQGELAGDILLKKIDPARFPIDNFNLSSYNVNVDTLRRIAPAWSLPVDVRRAAAKVFGTDAPPTQTGQAGDKPHAD